VVEATGEGVDEHHTVEAKIGDAAPGPKEGQMRLASWRPLMVGDTEGNRRWGGSSGLWHWGMSFFLL
jgi:hypothetical protein